MFWAARVPLLRLVVCPFKDNLTLAPSDQDRSLAVFALRARSRLQSLEQVIVFALGGLLKVAPQITQILFISAQLLY